MVNQSMSFSEVDCELRLVSAEDGSLLCVAPINSTALGPADDQARAIIADASRKAA